MTGSRQQNINFTFKSWNKMLLKNSPNNRKWLLILMLYFHIKKRIHYKLILHKLININNITKKLL